MSISILLIPAAISAITAVSALTASAAEINKNKNKNLEKNNINHNIKVTQTNNEFITKSFETFFENVVNTTSTLNNQKKLSDVTSSKLEDIIIDSDNQEKVTEDNILNEYHIIITEMNDELILNDVLASFNYNIAVGLANRDITSDIIFYKNEENNFIAVFSKEKEDELIPVLENIRKEYGEKVQEKVYKEVLEKYKNYNFVLEKETVNDDNSIVLTFNVGDK